jgi:hypothetical protein
MMQRPDNGKVEKLITFLHYKDLSAATRFVKMYWGFPWPLIRDSVRSMVFPQMDTSAGWMRNAEYTRPTL